MTYKTKQLSIFRIFYFSYLFPFTLNIVIYFFLIDLLVHLENYLKNFDPELRLFLNSKFLLGPWDGYPSIYNYLKIGFLVGLMVWAFAKTQKLIHLAWAFTFFIVLLDDSLEIHEQMGSYFRSALSIPSVLGLSPQQLGELMTWGFLAIPVVAALIYGFWRSSAYDASIGIVWGIIFSALVFFAVGVDVIHDAAATIPLVGVAGKVFTITFVIIEDGGEMVTISVACAVGLLVVRHFLKAEQND